MANLHHVSSSICQSDLVTNDQTKNTIEICQRKMVRKILGVSTRDRISKKDPC
jgi:hypothetical protein